MTAQQNFKNIRLVTGLMLLGLTQLLGFSVSAQESLESMIFRPRIQDVLPYQETYTAPSGVPVSGNRLSFDYFKTSIQKGAPQFIAKLEKAYPNAIFAFVGRDTQAIADVTEAFYLSIGQKNRVVQVAVSGPTLAGMNDTQVLKYLENFGFDLKNLDAKRPFIFVDTISRGEVIDGALISGRQGRNLLRIIYQAYKKTGGSLRGLLKKVNMIGLRVSTFAADKRDNQNRYYDISELEKAYEANKQMFESNAFNVDRVGYDLVIPIIKDTAEIFNESGYDHFTGAWHDKFQSPVAEKSALVPNPGPATDISIRRSVLWFQHQIIDIVNSSDFRKKVMAEAAKLGVTFENLTLDQQLISCRVVYGK